MGLPCFSKILKEPVPIGEGNLVAMGTGSFRIFDGVALLLEDPERTRPHRDQVSLPIEDPPLGGRRPPRPVHDLAPADYAPLPDRSQEVYVHLRRRRPQAHERGDGEPHRVVYERGVNAAVQGAVAVEVCFLDIDVHDGPPGIDLLYPGSHVLRERDLLIEVLRKMVQLLFTQSPYIV